MGAQCSWTFSVQEEEVDNDPQVDWSSQQLHVRLKLLVGSTEWL